ncbi:cbhB [Symbiodinium natans]|uniref:cellulose 1,4-beta-cellobiosidase (non-reducing end) n=1 Tax=Symbiodinium natans TaxID=878477 RepID=A0A812SFZ0_9DINO|nr:cbhB [Symbiodinium natans]
MALWTCDAGACSKDMKSIVLDANWRWLHNGQYTNCYKDGDWGKTLCPDPVTCALNCHMEGNSEKQYKSTYGIQPIQDGVELGFVTTTKYRSNYGSRVYMLDDENNYQMFKLKKREFTACPANLNGAVCFVEMDADGGKARSGGTNAAGAKYGTGYCDAQCPHDMKFMNGKANIVGWNASHDPPIGSWQRWISGRPTAVPPPTPRTLAPSPVHTSVGALSVVTIPRMNATMVSATRTAVTTTTTALVTTSTTDVATASPSTPRRS